MKKLLLLIISITLLSSSVYAQIPEPITIEDPDSSAYWEDAGDKAVKGIANVTLGWTQPIQDVRTSDGSKNIVNVILDGVTVAAARTIVGAVQLVTAPCPKIGWEGDAELVVNPTEGSDDDVSGWVEKTSPVEARDIQIPREEDKQ